MQNRPIVYAWIFARGGSKGLPGKNIRPLGGRPLLAHAIDTAMQSSRIDRVFVSTESEAIAEIGLACGAEVPFLRPMELARDDAPERLAWKHAVEWLQGSEYLPMDVMVSLPPTAPLRTVSEVESGIGLFLKGGWDTVLAVSRSERHPSFNMVSLSEAGEIGLISPPQEYRARRQDFPPVYNISTAFYITSPDVVLQTDSIWAGRVGAVEIPAEHAVDIDSRLDFDFAEFLLERRDEKDG